MANRTGQIRFGKIWNLALAMPTDVSRSVWLYGLSVAITIVGSCVAYNLLGQPALTGIDDANITQVYGRNIANGHGYVYTPGYERVEGSTSFLWTMINTVSFMLSSEPELLLLTIVGLLTTGSIYFSIAIFDLIIRHAGYHEKWGIAFASLYLSGLFGFFAWNVLTLMDLSVWTFLFLFLVYAILKRLLEDKDDYRFSTGMAALSVLMVIARPEAMLLVPAILLIAASIDIGIVPSMRSTARAFGPALLASIATIIIAMITRLIYFGVPLPNTYYAKVSTNILDNIIGGSKYIYLFLLREPFAEILLLITVFCLLIFGWRSFLLRDPFISNRFSRAILFISIVIVFVLGIQLIKGADHFGSFRFFQPIYPLFFVPLFVLVIAVHRANIIPSALPLRLSVMLFVAACIGYLSVKMIDFRFHNGIENEFGIARRAQTLGDALSELQKDIPEFRVASISAGGIAKAFEGRVLDLMGLNWPKMAHASKRRSGPANHNVFDESVFWSESPELVIPHILPERPQSFEISISVQMVLKYLPKSHRFQSEYLPVSISVDGGYMMSFVRRDWANNISRSREMIVIPWDDVIFN